MNRISVFALFVLLVSAARTSNIPAQSANGSVNSLLTRAAQAAGFDHIGLNNTTVAPPGNANPHVPGKERAAAHAHVAACCSAAGTASFR